MVLKRPVTRLFAIHSVIGRFIMKDKRDYKFKFWFRISKGYFPWYRVVKFRGANNIDLHLLGLKFNWGMPYLHKFIFEMGYDAGFRGD